MSDAADVWGAFSHDPRDPDHAVLRAADRDREVIRGVLATAYADGRLDREELDERTESLVAAKTLGELPALVADLVAPVPVRARPAVDGPVDLERVARRTYADERRATVLTLVGVSALCWVIWAVTGFGFVWPAIVTAALALNVVRKVAAREEEVRAEVRRLEKRQRRALKPPEQPMGDD